jgi:hypothetical protein
LTTAGTGTPFIQILGVRFLRRSPSFHPSDIMQITDQANAFAQFPTLNAQRVQTVAMNANITLPNTGNGSGNTSTNSSTGSTGSGSDSRNSGAVVNAVVSDQASTSGDLSQVKRNSYVLMGLVIIAIMLMIANLVMSLRKNHGYKQVGAPGSVAPAHFTDSAYTTPYDR